VPVFGSSSSKLMSKLVACSEWAGVGIAFMKSEPGTAPNPKDNKPCMNYMCLAIGI